MTMDSNGDAALQQPISKSKKKRMRQRAAKAKAAADGIGGDASAGATKAGATSGVSAAAVSPDGGRNRNQTIGGKKTGGDPLNPHARLRDEVASRGGYGPGEVDRAMDEMWNLQLPYDEIDAVLKYMAGAKNNGNRAAIPPPASRGVNGGSSSSLLTRGRPHSLSPANSNVILKRSSGDADSDSTAPTVLVSLYSSADVSPRNVIAEEEEPAETTAAVNLKTTAALNLKTTAVVHNGNKKVGGATIAEIPRNGNSPPAPGPVAPAPHHSAAGGGPAAAARTKKPKKRRSPQQQRMDLLVKLNTVADYDNVHDAAFAVIEWATKVAKPHELGMLCTECDVLQTILRRSVLECPNNAEFSNLLPSLVGLLCSLLGRPRTETTATAQAFKSILMGARKAVAACPPAPQNGNASGVDDKDDDGPPESGAAVISELDKRIAGEVSSAIVGVVCKSWSCSGGDSPMLAKLQKEVQELEGASSRLQRKQQQQQGDGVTDLSVLLARRDRQRLAAEKAALVATLIAKAVRGSPESMAGSNGENGGYVADDDAGDGVGHLFDETNSDVGRVLVENERGYGTMQEQLRGAQISYDSDRQTIQSELQSCISGRHGIDVRREELLRQLKRLDEEEDAIQRKEVVLREKLDEVTDRFSSEQSDLKAGIQERKELLDVGSACKSLREVMTRFQDSLVVSAKSSSSTAIGRSEGQLQTNVVNFFATVLHYFQTEADCVEFLTRRAESLRPKMRELEREITQCRNLGMTTNVSQMTHVLMDLSKNADEDNAVANSIVEEVKQMRDVLMLKIEEFAPRTDKRSFFLRHCAVLKNMVVALSRIGVACDGLQQLLPGAATNGKHQLQDAVAVPIAPACVGGPGQPQVNESGEFVAVNRDKVGAFTAVASEVLPPVTVAPVPTVKSPAPAPAPALKARAPALKAPAAPKFSWGKPIAVPQTNRKKSLLEIQQEEMSAKQAVSVNLQASAKQSVSDDNEPLLEIQQEEMSAKQAVGVNLQALAKQSVSDDNEISSQQEMSASQEVVSADASGSENEGG